MDRPPGYRAFMAAAALVASALVAAPIWDRLHFRSVSAGPGSSIPLAAIMPDVRGPVAAAPSSAPAPDPRTATPPEPIRREMQPIGSQAGRPERRDSSSGRVVPAPPSPPPFATPSAGHASRQDRPAPVPVAPARIAEAAQRPSASPVSAPPTNVIGGGRDRSTTQAAAWSLPPQIGLATAPWLLPAPTAEAPQVPVETASATTGAAASGENDSSPPSDAVIPTRLSLAPSSSALSPGQPLVVKVLLSEGGSISSVPFHLKFDPEVLQYVGAHEGGLFRSTSLQPVLLASVNPSRPGDLAVGLSMIESSGLLSGSGGILEIEFRALQPGHSELLFDRASIRGATGEPLPVELIASRVTVR
jgi:cohesin domain-containing protein